MDRMPLIYEIAGVKTRVCSIEQHALFFLCRKKMVKFEKKTNQYYVQNVNKFLDYYKKTYDVKAFEELYKIFKGGKCDG